MTMTLPHVQDFLNKLRGVIPDGDGRWKAYCPVHESTGKHRPSLGVAIGSDNKVILHCLACSATTAEIVHAAGSTMRALFPPEEIRAGKHSRRRGGKKTAEYIYRDDEGAIVYKVERREQPDGSKTFWQLRPDGMGGWKVGVKGIQRVLYRLPELVAAKKPSTVFIVEGEKKVESLMEWGLIATCNVGGAGKWSKPYAKYFAGHDVVILPDNDPTNPETGKRTGYEHAADVIESVRSVANSVRIVELPGLPIKGDIVDWKQMGGTLPQLLKLLEQPAAPLPQLRIEQKQVTQTQQMEPLDLRISLSRTDVGNGKRFVRNHNDTLRYCYPWRKWLAWDGKRWTVDQSGEVYRNAKTVSPSMWDEIAKIGKDVNDTMLAEMMTFAKISASDGSICRMIHCAESEPGQQFLPHELDANPWLLNVQNGTVDLRNGVLSPHNKADLITQISPTTFDIDAKCPTWESFIRKVFETDEMCEYVQRLCGCWATGVVRDETLPILWGVGSNGKTTFVNAIMSVLGSDYAMKAATDFLMVKRFAGHPTEKADLFRKRFVICSETDEGGRLDEATVKDLTGRERIRARRMREDNWEFEPTHKIALMTNHLPQIRGTDHGIWRRIRKIEFSKQFWNPDAGESGPPELERDNTLAERIVEEYSGILTWIVRGAIEWNHFGEQAPAEVANWTTEYRESQDVLKSFIEDCCLVSPELFVTPADLYAKYSQWARESNEFAFRKNKFGMMMTERGFRKDPGNRWYIGLTVRSGGFN